MKAIFTKYHGPGNVRGSYVEARDGEHNKARVPYASHTSSEAAHDAAALALCRKLKWSGTLVRGGNGNKGEGNVYVWLSPWDHMEVPACPTK